MDPNAVTTIDLTDPQTLIAMVRGLEPAPSFLLDTYFPCDPGTDIFHSDKVLVDYDTQNKKLAPFIKVGSVNSDRDTFYTDEFSPARIAPSRLLSVDDLKKRGFGESLFSGMAPDQREAAIAGRDFIDLKDRIRRRKEKMAADCLMADGYECQYIDKDGKPTEKKTVAFHGDVNDCLYTPGKLWDAADANLLGDLKAMSRVLTSKGCAAADVIAGADAAELIQSNSYIQKLFDNRRFEMGKIEPKLQESGALVLGFMNVDGVLLRVIQYMKEYEDEDGTMTPFIAPNKVIMTAPNAGKTLYASVTQMDEPGGPFNTYAEKYVPKYISNHEDDIRKFILSSRPLLVPKKKGCWVCADVLTASAGA